VTRFLVLWRQNPVAPASKSLSEALELNEKIFAAMDSLIEKGEVEEIGPFQDGISGYAILKGEPADVYRNVSMFLPYFHCEVHAIVPYEKVKEISISQLKAQIAAAQK
jgi:hypothetical protein